MDDPSINWLTGQLTELRIKQEMNLDSELCICTVQGREDVCDYHTKNSQV